MKRMKILKRTPIFLWRSVMMPLLAMVFIFSSCGDDDDNGVPAVQTMNVLSITANNQNLQNGAVNIARDLEIVIVFNNSLNTGAFNNAFSLSSSGGAVNTNVSFTESNSRVTITNTEELDYLTQYTLSIAAGELGANGEELENAVNISFTTVDEVLFSGGEGTANDPFKIGNAEDLALINSYLGEYFIQIADVDLSGTGGEAGWEPIGSDEFPFTGSYDGDGFSITNLAITNLVADGVNDVGLFGTVDGAEISNMNVSTSSAGVTGTRGNGILIGQLRSGTITRCHTSGIVAGDLRTGGLIGDMESGTVHQCSSSATINAERSRAGGLIGIVSDPFEQRVDPGVSNITESFATGNVTSGSARVGGLIGSVSPLGNVANCYATGTVIAPNRAASVLGWLDGSVSLSYGTGDVTITQENGANDHPGYFVGELRAGGTFENIYYDNNLTVNYVGNPVPEGRGEPVDISGMACANPNATLAGFEFGSVWACQDGAWPKLAWQD